MKKRHGLIKLNDSINIVCKPAFNKNGGNILHKIFHNWLFIIGPKFHKQCHPAKIDYYNGKATLLIKTQNPSLSLFLSGMEGQIVAKIASFFGFKAIVRIRVMVDLKKAYSSTNTQPQAASKIQLTDQQLGNLKDVLLGITDQEVKDSMSRFIKAFANYE
jgi:hypothetical protein